VQTIIGHFKVQTIIAHFKVQTIIGHLKGRTVIGQIKMLLSSGLNQIIVIKESSLYAQVILRLIQVKFNDFTSTTLTTKVMRALPGKSQR